MLSYFTDYRLGMSLGINGILHYFIYFIALVLLLGQWPNRLRDWLCRIAECAACWIMLQLVSAVCYGIFGDLNLNQAQQVIAAALYAILFCRYPVSKRIVMSCAVWASINLTMSIIGAAGLLFGQASMLIHAIVFLALTLYFHHFAIDAFPLAPKQYIAVVIILTLAGVIAAENRTMQPQPGVIHPYVLITSVSLLAIVMLVFNMFHQIIQNYQRNQELLSFHQKDEAEKNAILLTQSSYEKMRELRHELNNRDSYIRTLLEQKKYDELEAFVHKEHEYLADLQPYVDCGNRTINAIVNEKIALAQASGVSIRCELSVPESLPFSEASMFSLLSNLLDNSIEAAAASGQDAPDILLQIRQERGYLFIHLENPVDKSVEPYLRLRLQTTKREREAHGYGTRIIRQIADRYNGHVQYSCRDGLFRSDVMLSMEQGGDEL